MSTAATNIAWTDRTWNPVRGCSRVSEGCRNCYAERWPTAWTDYPIAALGDEPRKPAPMRRAKLIGYDGNKYVTILIGDVTTVTDVKQGYLLSRKDRNSAPVSQRTLDRLPFVRIGAEKQREKLSEWWEVERTDQRGRGYGLTQHGKREDAWSRAREWTARPLVHGNAAIARVVHVTRYRVKRGGK